MGTLYPSKVYTASLLKPSQPSKGPGFSFIKQCLNISCLAVKLKVCLLFVFYRKETSDF